MLDLWVIQRSQLIKNVIELELDLIDFRDGMGFNLSDSIENTGVIGVHLREILIKRLVMFVESAIEEGEVVREFGFGDGDDVDEFELVLGGGDGHGL